MLPSNWEFRFAVCNVYLETGKNWDWCDFVIISAIGLLQKYFVV